jgi:hypothetical protein
MNVNSIKNKNNFCLPFCSNENRTGTAHATRGGTNCDIFHGGLAQIASQAEGKGIAGKVRGDSALESWGLRVIVSFHYGMFESSC